MLSRKWGLAACAEGLRHHHLNGEFRCGGDAPGHGRVMNQPQGVGIHTGQGADPEGDAIDPDGTGGGGPLQHLLPQGHHQAPFMHGSRSANRAWSVGLDQSLYNSPMPIKTQEHSSSTLISRASWLNF